MNVIELKNVRFQYSGGFAIDDLSFEVGKGEIFALLGPNGTGKTTSIRLINGLLRATSGSVSVLSKDPYSDGIDIRRRTGVLTETPALYERLTAMENLLFFGKLYGMGPMELQERITELLTLFDLQAHAEQRVGTFSRGMRQRLAIARALLHHPELLFLDEPTSNLDPEITRQVQEMILRVKEEEGCSVVICTHRLYEAEQICDRVAIMHKGKLLSVGTLPQLRQATGLAKHVEISFQKKIAASQRRQISGIAHVEGIEDISPNTISLQIQNYDMVPTILSELVNMKFAITSVIPQELTLEQVYFHLQGKVEAQDA